MKKDIYSNIKDSDALESFFWMYYFL